MAWYGVAVAAASLIAGVAGAESAKKRERARLEAERRAQMVAQDAERKAAQAQIAAEQAQRRFVWGVTQLEKESEAETARQAGQIKTAEINFGEDLGEARERTARRRGYFGGTPV